MELALQIFHESTSAALKIYNKPHPDECIYQTSDFIDNIIKIWKIFIINRPNKDIRFNDE